MKVAKSCLGVLAAIWLSVSAAQEVPVLGPTGTGARTITSMMQSMQTGQLDQLPLSVRRAIEGGLGAGYAARDRYDARTVEFAEQQNEQWLRATREAYVASLPPRDREFGSKMLLGDRTLSGANGRLYFFVSRSMPESMLRAYAVEAMHLNATLVVKGIRPGDTIRDYLEDVMESYNTAEGQLMAGMEINPNLYDMFDVKVVPAVVWSNRAGLNDIGSGCPDLPESAVVEELSFEGPAGNTVLAPRPVCAKVPESTYYKISGALAIPYVLDRFKEAGLPAEVVSGYLERLADKAGNVHQGMVAPVVGNAIAPVGEALTLDRMPKHVLRYWSKQLETSKVTRGPYGPAFSQLDEDPDYRRELEGKIRHGLGL